jgi:hypothetical protein
VRPWDCWSSCKLCLSCLAALHSGAMAVQLLASMRWLGKNNHCHVHPEVAVNQWINLAVLGINSRVILKFSWCVLRPLQYGLSELCNASNIP